MLVPGQTKGRRRVSRNAFAAASEAKLFARRRFYANPFNADAGKPGDVCPHRIAMLTDARGFAHNREVEMRDAAAPGAHAIHSKDKEAVGRGAAPLRVARWKMGADVAFGECAQNGVR